MRPSTSKQVSGPSRRKRRVAESDSDEDQYPTQNFTQFFGNPLASSSVIVRTQQDNNVGNEAVLIKNLVKFFLNYSSSRVPVKRADITKLVGISSKSFQAIYDEARANLENVYGLKVTEIEHKNLKVYLVYSRLEVELSNIFYTEHQSNEISLLFLVLSYIFMKAGEVQENHLFCFLMRLNIVDREKHSHFGDVGKLIRDTFPRQFYLKRTKFEIEGSGEHHFNLAWGPRAELEFCKKKILKNVAGLMNKSPAAFINQYNEANKTEVEPADNNMIIDD